MIDAGRSMEGNSIWKRSAFNATGLLQTHQTLVLGEKHSNSGIDFADRQRDQHCNGVMEEYWKSCCWAVVSLANDLYALVLVVASLMHGPGEL